MKKILYISLLAFVLNFVWEIGQAFLYSPHYVGWIGLIMVHLRASIGDVLIVCIIILLDAIIFRSLFMYRNGDLKRLLIIAIIGFIFAVLVEKYALITGRWSYGPMMPIIPFFHVGLLPILQMIVIPVSIVAIVKKKKD